MPISLMIVDDFLGNPDAIRDIALKLEYSRPDDDVPTGYPGRNATNRININGLDAQISRLVGQPVKGHPRSSHLRPRITLENEKGNASVHIDPAHLSGILYLTKPEHCKGGTNFFKHVPTQTTRASLDKRDMDAVGAKTPEDADRIFQDLLAKDTNDESKWDCIMEVPMMYNRLILFNPGFYHNAGPGFGDSMENGRLIFPLFFLFENA